MTKNAVKVKKPNKIKEMIARSSKFARAAFILVLAFLAVGLCTIGSAASPGSAYRAVPDAEAVLYLNYQSGNGLDEVWVNVGSIYTRAGADAKVTVNYALVPSTSASSISWSSVNRIGTHTFGNIYSSGGSGFSGANYNWVRIADLVNEEEGTDNALGTNYHLIKVETDTEMLINEIIFIDTAGNVIPAYTQADDVRAVYGSGYDSRTAMSDAFRLNPSDAQELIDAQQSLRSGNAAYFDFTQDEMYSLMQIDNILLGRQAYEGSVYPIDSESGPLSPLFMMLGVLVFGRSPFGLRFMPLLFTAALVALAYFFGKELFKSDGFGLLFAGLFAAGGLALTVGRLGLTLPISAFFVVLSYFFMYRFYAKGLSGDAPVRSAMSVLISGLAFAFAFAADPKMLIAGLGSVALFVLGAVRHHKSCAYNARRLRREMSEKNAAPNISEEQMQANIDKYEQSAAALSEEVAYKNKLIYLFFFAAFIIGTVLVTLLSAIPSYYSYVRYYEANPQNPTLGIFSLIMRALGDAFTVGNMTSYTAANASNAFGWLIGLKGATLLSATEGSRYLALNVQMNPAIMVTAFVCLLFMTVYAVLYLATGGKKGAYGTKYAPRILRAYAVFGLGVLTSLLSFAFFPNAGAAHSFLFSVFYIGFIPLTVYTAYVHDKSSKTSVLGIQMNKTMKVLFALLIVYAVVFILMLPMTFCFPTYTAAARYCFGWTTFVNNGFYRV